LCPLALLALRPLRGVSALRRLLRFQFAAELEL
jgi:hypothetical protein